MVQSVSSRSTSVSRHSNLERRTQSCTKLRSHPPRLNVSKVILASSEHSRKGRYVNERFVASARDRGIEAATHKSSDERTGPPMTGDNPDLVPMRTQDARERGRKFLVPTLLVAILGLLLVIVLRPPSSPPTSPQSIGPVSSPVTAGSSLPTTAAGPATQILGRWTGYCGDFDSANFFPDGTVTLDLRSRSASSVSYSFPDSTHLKLSGSGGATVLPIAFVAGTLKITALPVKPVHSCTLYRPGRVPSDAHQELLGAWRSNHLRLDGWPCQYLFSARTGGSRNNQPGTDSGLRFWGDGLVDLDANNRYLLTAPYSVTDTQISVRPSSSSDGISATPVDYRLSGDTLSITFFHDLTIEPNAQMTCVMTRSS